MKNIVSTRQWKKGYKSSTVQWWCGGKKKKKTTLYLKRTAASTRNALILLHIKERANLYFTKHVFITNFFSCETSLIFRGVC